MALQDKAFNAPSAQLVEVRQLTDEVFALRRAKAIAEKKEVEVRHELGQVSGGNAGTAWMQFLRALSFSHSPTHTRSLAPHRTLARRSASSSTACRSSSTARGSASTPTSSAASSTWSSSCRRRSTSSRYIAGRRRRGWPPTTETPDRRTGREVGFRCSLRPFLFDRLPPTSSTRPSLLNLSLP